MARSTNGSSDLPTPPARPANRITTQVPVADFFGVRDAALRAHETQIDPDSHWFAVPHDLEAEVWGTDDYELARRWSTRRCPRTTSSPASGSGWPSDVSAAK